MSDEFDWTTENEDVVQQSVQGVAAYINAGGNIIIRQERDWDDNEDRIIVLTFDGARKLVDKLRELLNSGQMA